MPLITNFVCFILLCLPFASGFALSVKCPNIFSYCSPQQDCPLTNRIRHDGKDFMPCIYNATSTARIGVCCTDVADDLYYDFEAYEDDFETSNTLIRTKRMKRQAEETPESSSEGSSIESPIQTEAPRSENNEDVSVSGRAEHAPIESSVESPKNASGDFPSKNRASHKTIRKYPPQKKQPLNRYSLPGISFTGPPRGNIPKKRKIIRPKRRKINVSSSVPQSNVQATKPQPKQQSQTRQSQGKDSRKPKQKEHGKPQERKKQSQTRGKQPHLNRERSRTSSSPNNKNKFNNGGTRGKITSKDQHRTKPGRGASKISKGQPINVKPAQQKTNRAKNQANMRQSKQNRGQQNGRKRGHH